MYQSSREATNLATARECTFLPTNTDGPGGAGAALGEDVDGLDVEALRRVADWHDAKVANMPPLGPHAMCTFMNHSCWVVTAVCMCVESTLWTAVA